MSRELEASWKVASRASMQLSKVLSTLPTVSIPWPPRIPPGPYCICVCPHVVYASTSRASRAMQVWCGEQPPSRRDNNSLVSAFLNCVCVCACVWCVDHGADADENKLVKSHLSCNLGRWVVLQTTLDCRLLAEPKGPRSRQDRRGALRIWGICCVTPTAALSSLLGNPRCRSQNASAAGGRRQQVSQHWTAC